MHVAQNAYAKALWKVKRAEGRAVYVQETTVHMGRAEVIGKTTGTVQPGTGHMQVSLILCCMRSDRLAGGMVRRKPDILNMNCKYRISGDIREAKQEEGQEQQTDMQKSYVARKGAAQECSRFIWPE